MQSLRVYWWGGLSRHFSGCLFHQTWTFFDKGMIKSLAMLPLTFCLNQGHQGSCLLCDCPFPFFSDPCPGQLLYPGKCRVAGPPGRWHFSGKQKRDRDSCAEGERLATYQGTKASMSEHHNIFALRVTSHAVPSPRPAISAKTYEKTTSTLKSPKPCLYQP